MIKRDAPAPLDRAESPSLGKSRALSALPAFLALCYPAAPWLLYRSAALARAAAGWDRALPWLGVLFAFALSALPSLAAFQSLWKQGDEKGPPAARRVAHLAFAAPALYTLERVLFAAVRATSDDRVLWVAAWAVLAILTARGPRASPRAPRAAGGRKLQIAHGIGAAFALASFLLAHLGNQLVGLWSVGAHAAAMGALRHWYRDPRAEPVLTSAFGFLIVSGAMLIGRPGAEPSRAWRALQTSTGAGLGAFIVAHLTVILGARIRDHAETDWAFATGGPTGLFGSLSNARLIPYYGFAVFITVAHLACGLRGLLLAHDWRQRSADGLGYAIVGGGAILAAAILAAMCGMHLR